MTQINKPPKKIDIIQENKISILAKIEKEKLPDYPNTMYTYQRLVNNLIWAIGIIKSPSTFYPYLDRDQSWYLYINNQDKDLTAIDIKTINIENVHKKIQEFITTIEDKNIQKTLTTTTKQIEKGFLDYCNKEKHAELDKKERHAINPVFFESDKNDDKEKRKKNREGKRIIESLYNLMWADMRMKYFDYDSDKNLCTINHEWKKWLLNELYQEIDDINHHRFTNIEDIFPGSDYPNLKNKTIKAEDIDTTDIIYVTGYLLAAHHGIDDMTELYNELQQQNKVPIWEPLREKLKQLVKIGIKKFSTSNQITPIIDIRNTKGKSSKLKRNRGSLIERIAIAWPYLEKLYDFKTIKQIFETNIKNIEIKLQKQFPESIKYIKVRLKSEFSCKNKILRDKRIVTFRDMIGIQIFVDSAQQDREKITKEIFWFINKQLHKQTINNEQKTIHISEIKIDNKRFIDEDKIDWLIEELNTKDYKVDKRPKKNKHTKQKNRNEQESITNFFTYWKTGGNGKRQDIKEIIKYNIANTSGIEVQILPYGESVNKNEAAHEFLDSQKTIDLAINTNAVCPREEYCNKKDIAITKRAYNLTRIGKQLKKWEKSEYTQDMFQQERYYTMPVSSKNREFIHKTEEQRDPDVIKIEKWEIKINLLALVELSSNLSKRRAADMIIMDQVNKELQNGKLIQYHYYDDINEDTHPHHHITEKNQKIITDTYPWIKNIERNEVGELLPSSVHFINPSSKTRIQTGQTPKNAYVFIPDHDGERTFIQKIPELSYALKRKNINDDYTKEELVNTLNMRMAA